MVGKPYPPLSLVVVVRVWLVSLWRIVTVAAGTTAPVASVTLPSNVPYRACAVHVRGAEKFRRVARLTGISQRMLRAVLRNKENLLLIVHQDFCVPRCAIALFVSMSVSPAVHVLRRDKNRPQLPIFPPRPSPTLTIYSSDI